MTAVFKVYKKADNSLITSYTSDVGAIEQEYLFTDYTHTEQAAEPTKVYEGKRILSKLEFLHLFTISERIAVKTSSDPVTSDLWNMISIAEYIDLDNTTTLQGLGYLTMTGLLTADRAEEIKRG